MNILTENLLNEYFDNLKSNQVEVLVDKNTIDKLNSKGHVKVYVGFELSGALHIGHIIPLSIISWFSKFENCTVYILFSKFHALANGKTVDYAAYNQLKNIKMFKNCEFILSSSYDIDKVHTLDQFMRTPKYLDLVDFYSRNIKTKKLTKSSMLSDREDVLEKNISVFLYSLYQSVDINYLDIDVSLGGMDQRKIHMFHNDEFKTPCTYIHTPLLLDSKGQKISKSLNNTILNIDKNIMLNFEKLNEDYKNNLSRLIRVCTFNDYDVETFFTQLI